MELFQVLILAFVQGLTEFLPISSSAHLILPSELLGWPDQGLAFDVATHVGSLVAVISYFYRDIINMVVAWWRQITGGPANTESHMAWAIIVATIPVVVVGLLINDYMETYFRSTTVIATTTVFYGLLLWWADRVSQRRQQSQSADSTQISENVNWTALNWTAIVVIGFAQALALVPGTSRSGITMTAALFMGLDRQLAARFSFLLSIPVILAAGGLKTFELVEAAQPVPWIELVTGMMVSALVAYVCIYLFLQFINRIGFMPFVLYRLGLGVLLFALIAAA